LRHANCYRATVLVAAERWEKLAIRTAPPNLFRLPTSSSESGPSLPTGRALTETGQASPAVLHAYDGATGRRLWHSGKAMATSAPPGSLWSGLGQIYVGTQDGTLYAFGFNDERRHTNGG
jgi:outer membrane protein assembly factor BamB